MDKDEKITFARCSSSDMDGFPRENYPKRISMKKGNKHFIVELKEGYSTFYCYENFHEMTENEFNLMLTEYIKHVDEKHGHRIKEDHFLLTKVPQRLKNDYQQLLDERQVFDDIGADYEIDNIDDCDIESEENVFRGNMKESFIDYLIQRGYKQFTDNGAPSTVYDYAKRIEKVMCWEGYNSWSEVANNIDYLCRTYGIGGAKEHLGKISNNAVKCALLRFQEFIAFIN